MQCPTCKNDNPAGSAYCAVCSEPFNKPAPPPRDPAALPPASAAPAAKARYSRVKLGLVVAVSALFALGLATRKPPKASSFTVTDLEGNKMRLSECEGRPVFLYVWETNSARSVENLDMLDSLYSKYKDGPVCFMAVTIDDDYEASVRPFAAQYGIRYPVFNGSGYIAGQFWPPTIPMLYLIDREGYLRDSFSPSRDDQAKIESRVRKYSGARSPEAKWVDQPDPPPDFSDSPEGSDALTAESRRLLEEQRFDELDALAADLRSNKVRFASGRWKLGAFYEGVAEMANPRTTDEQWRQRLELLSKWRETRSASITAPVALGAGLTSYAWYARSGAAAKDVTSEDMALFRQRLVQARSVLDFAVSRSTRCPHAYFAMEAAGIGQGLDREAFETIFSSAVAFEPEYHDYYVAKARYLSPIWHGEPGEWEAFAEESAREHGLDLYARIAIGSHRGTNVYGRFGVELLDRSGVSWPMLRDSLLEIDRRHPGGRENLNQLAWFAVLAKDKDAAKAAFGLIGDRYDKNLWRSRAAFARARSWALKTTVMDRLARLVRRR